MLSSAFHVNGRVGRGWFSLIYRYVEGRWGLDRAERSAPSCRRKVLNRQQQINESGRLTVSTILGLNKQIKQLEDAKASLRIVSDAISTRVGEEALKTSQKIGESQVQGELVKEKVKDDLLLRKVQYERTIRETRENIETRKKSVVQIGRASCRERV